MVSQHTSFTIGTVLDFNALALARRLWRILPSLLAFGHSPPSGLTICGVWLLATSRRFENWAVLFFLYVYLTHVGRVIAPS